MKLRERKYLSEAASKFLVVRPGHPEFDKIYGKTESDFYVISVHRNENDAEKRMFKVRRNTDSSSLRKGVRIVQVSGSKLKRGSWVSKSELDRMTV